MTHGGTAGRLVEALLGLGVDHRRVFGPLGNCHWSELSFQATRWRLMRHNSSVPEPVGRPAPVASPHDSAGRPAPDPAPALSRAGATPEEAPASPAQDSDAAS